MDRPSGTKTSIVEDADSKIPALSDLTSCRAETIESNSRQEALQLQWWRNRGVQLREVECNFNGGKTVESNFNWRKNCGVMLQL